MREQRAMMESRPSSRRRYSRGAPMKARDVMTTKVISAPADMPTRDIARLLLKNHISAVPLVDEAGALVGMVSEGDLIGRDEGDRDERRDWWLALLAEGQPLSSEFLSTVHPAERPAREVMSSPGVTGGGDTD